MKKLIVILSVLVLFGSSAIADVDLSGMNFDELVALSHQVDQAIWQSDGWEEVSVPPGTWKIGEDIPEATWTISSTESGELTIYYCEAIDEANEPITYPNPYKHEVLRGEKNWLNKDGQYPSQAVFECKSGKYLVIKDGNAVFTPYTGKPSLGFKKK